MTAIAEQNLTERVAQTAEAAAQSAVRVQEAEEEVRRLEEEHSRLLGRVNTCTSAIVAGAQIDENLSDLAETTGAVARKLAAMRIQLRERERESAAATLAANKSLFEKTAIEAEDLRTIFHASHRQSCLSFGQLMDSIGRLTALANACRTSFGLRNDQKNTLADFNSEPSLNPLTKLLDEFESSRNVQMDKMSAVMGVQCLPLVPKIVPRKKKS
jgi:hypothetical protein